MTGFQVRPGALDTFAGQLDGGGSSLSDQYVTDATLYVGDHVKLSSGSTGKVFAALDERTAKVRERLVKDNYTIYQRCGASATNLKDSAQLYRTTDAGTAKHLDSQYHPTGVPEADEGNYSAPAGTNPSSSLTTPSPDAGVPDLVNDILGLTSWFSISGAIFEIFKIFGFDPIGDLNEWLLGDTEAVGKVANALGHHADFDKQCSGVMTSGLTTMQGAWTGSAATAASGYFDDFADALSERSAALDHLSSVYNQVVAAIEELSATLADLITMVIDKGLEVLAALAAAGCLASVPGINAIAAIIGASKVYRLVKAIADFVDIWGKVWTPHTGVLGAIMLIDAALEDFDASARIPTTAYDNGAQSPAA